MSAVISACGKYRFRLERQVQRSADIADKSILSEDPIVWVMCNPSTADAETDDATIRKCKGFTARLGRSRMIVVNVFAFRSRHPKDLLKAVDPVGVGNVGHLRAACEIPNATIIAAWGEALPRKLRHLADVCYDILRENNRRIYCYGITDLGMPRHPVMLAYATPLEEFKNEHRDRR